MFRSCLCEDSVKKLYRRLAAFLHPDKGGEPDLMSLLTDSYEKALLEVKKISGKQSENIKYENVVNDILYDPSDERLTIITKIREYAEKQRKYKLDYLESVIEFMEDRGYMTSSQYNSLVKSYYSFKMDKDG